MTAEIAVILALITAAPLLFISNRWPPDVVSLILLSLLGLADAHPDLDLLPKGGLFSGFSSQAVMAIIGITVMGRVIDQSGLLTRAGEQISRFARGEISLRLALTSCAGLTSAFMQNIAAIALFIPLTSRLSTRFQIHLSRLLMPVSFTVIAGGTLTMIGSGPLIVLNDLLPKPITHFDLFSVTPIGLALTAALILFFYLFGSRLLPEHASTAPVTSSINRFREIYQLEGDVQQLALHSNSPLRKMSTGELEEQYGIELLALLGDDIILSPHRDIPLDKASHLAIIAREDTLATLLSCEGVSLEKTQAISNALSPEIAGFAEVVVRPGTWIVGRSIRQIRIRKRFGITPVAIFRGQQIIHKQLRDVQLQVGDTLLTHVRWRDLAALQRGDEFAVLGRDQTLDNELNGGFGRAMIITVITFALAIFTTMPIGLVFLAGMTALIAFRVITVQQAYKSVSWQTVFLLAGLIPLGLALHHTDTGTWLANNLTGMLDQKPGSLTLSISFAVLATLFGLFLSNIGATVLLVPLASQIAINSGVDPRPLALLIGVCVSNSFLLPTHQVNALVMTPGGYQMRDFLRIGGLVTLIYIVVTVFCVEVFYR